MVTVPSIGTLSGWLQLLSVFDDVSLIVEPVLTDRGILNQSMREESLLWEVEVEEVRTEEG
jgi:hypothetical protein